MSLTSLCPSSETEPVFKVDNTEQESIEKLLEESGVCAATVEEMRSAEEEQQLHQHVVNDYYKSEFCTFNHDTAGVEWGYINVLS